MGGDTKGLLDDIEEEPEKKAGGGSDTEEEIDNDVPDDKFDPLSKNKEGAPTLKKQSML